jgi:hypothetical protein
MPLAYLPNKNLVPGEHVMQWDDFVQEFGYTNHRKQLIVGMCKALNALKICGCEIVYIDGSFVTQKLVPKDWDGCYDEEGLDREKLQKLYPQFYHLVPPRESQKVIFKGEILPKSLEIKVSFSEKTMLDCFKQDFHTDTPTEKGIVKLYLKNYIV